MKNNEPSRQVMSLDQQGEPIKKTKSSLAIVIPTYNRIEKLKIAVQSVLALKYDKSEFDLHLVIHNSCSTDDTESYLNSLTHPSVKVTTVNATKLDADGNLVYVDAKYNMQGAVNAVPESVDWVWLLGDDDFIQDLDVISVLLQLQNKYEDLALVHFCQSRRSKRTNSAIKGTLIGLCNKMGFHEILGWISSIVVKREHIHKAFNSNLYENTQSAYWHSSTLLEVCAQNTSMFIDRPTVEPQDESQTQDSVQRWMKDNWVERYFYIIDDLKVLMDEKKIPDQLPPVFFRYLTYSLWDRYAAYLLADVLNTGGISEKNKGHWSRIEGIYKMIGDPVFKKQFGLWLSNLFGRVQEYVDLNTKTKYLKTKLIAEYNNQNSAVYEFSNIDPRLGL